MTALLPTRVSLYDFLFEDTLPIDSIFADIAGISIPQARVLIENGIQAIISGLMAYNQQHGGDAVLKKLLRRSQIKELRKYNAFNLKSMNAAYQNGHAINDILFDSTEIQKLVCQKLADQTQISSGQLRLLLGALSLLCLREIAILADYAQLDAQEIDCWFGLQPQFFQLDRTNANEINHSNNPVLDTHQLPNFDNSWHQITGYQQPTVSTSTPTEQIPHYAKVIGRTHQASLINNVSANNGQIIVDNLNNSEVLTFATIPNICLPYQRWLLQLAKISDIYLSRKRLKVSPEPVQPPSRPFVNFGFLDKDSKKNKQSVANKLESAAGNTPFWKNPVLILLVLVIGGLTLMAIGKYQYKKSQVIDTPVQTHKIKA
ncbi:hypothetical protein [Psychrobacter phenylpyruvicus]|uniref:Uncharacterized protein n=1 Tax=Psychrobacter phenylpyruvicus TaxID=29432 RepID=A0A379LLK3_9GAMM|nr:hypothetical protein [Psychrobacter phenylpyruvicus]SUD90995.1 Uncharacterised protein [Psychrobacter phenylpyruvicus]